MCSVAEMCPSDVCGVDLSKVVEWRLPSLIYFLTKNRGKYRLPKYRLQDLYFALQSSDGIAYCDIFARILRQIRQLNNEESPLPCIASTDEAIESFLSAKKRTKSHINLQKLVSKKRMAEMDAETRARVLSAFIDLLEEEYDIDLDVLQKDNAEETLINTGCDRHGNEYFYIIDDERLYMKDKSGRDVKLVVPPDLNYWKQFLNRFEASDDDNERLLYTMIYENILPSLQYTLTDYTQAFHRPNPDLLLANIRGSEEAEVRRMAAEQSVAAVKPPSVATPMSAGGGAEVEAEASPKEEAPGSNNPMSVASGNPLSVPPAVTESAPVPAPAPATPTLPPLHSNPNSVPTPLTCPVSSPLVCGPASVPLSGNGPRSDPAPASNPAPAPPATSVPAPPAAPAPELPAARAKLVFTCSMMAEAAKAKSSMGVAPDQFHSNLAVVRQFRERELQQHALLKASEQLTPEQLEKRRAKMAQIYQIRERCNLAPDGPRACCNNMQPVGHEDAQRAWQKLLIQHQEEKMRQQQMLAVSGKVAPFPGPDVYYAPRRMPFPAQPFPGPPDAGKRPYPVPWRPSPSPYDPMAGMVDLAGGKPAGGGGGKRRKTAKNAAQAGVESKAVPVSSAAAAAAAAAADSQQYLNPYEGELTITRHVNSAYQQEREPREEKPQPPPPPPHNGAEMAQNGGPNTQNLTSASLASLARLSNQMQGAGSNPTPPPQPQPNPKTADRQPYFFPKEEAIAHEYRSPNGAQGNANVQVQAKAPNTIQYIPSDPPPHPAAHRGPPRMPPGVYDYLPPVNGGDNAPPYPPPPPPASYYPPQPPQQHYPQQQQFAHDWGDYLPPQQQQQQQYYPQQQQQQGPAAAQPRNPVYGPM